MSIGFSKGWTNTDRLKRYKSNVLFRITQKEKLFGTVEEMLTQAQDRKFE
jgi:hypothetical protein